MNTQQQHGEPERREGLGGRVRRFVDTELSRFLDKEDRSTDRDVVDEPRGPHRQYEFDRPTESAPVPPYPEASGRADPAMTTAVPVDSGYDLPSHDDRGEETGSEPHAGRSSEQTAADAGAERVGLLNDPASLREQWQRVQGTFVDDPQRAVREAGELVERTLQEIQTNVARGQVSDPTSTEDLRVSFKRYREFFQRLLSA